MIVVGVNNVQKRVTRINIQFPDVSKDIRPRITNELFTTMWTNCWGCLYQDYRHYNNNNDDFDDDDGHILQELTTM